MRRATKLDVSGYVRQARRRTQMSQREFARACTVSPSTVSRAEAGRSDVGIATFTRLLRVAGLRIVVVDADTRRVPSMKELAHTRDLAERRFPAHLPLILDPQRGEWWGDHFNLVRPPETFRRDPAARRAHRLVFREQRGSLVYGGPVDWRERLRVERERHEREQLRRLGAYPPGIIPWNRRKRGRPGSRHDAALTAAEDAASGSGWARAPD